MEKATVGTTVQFHYQVRREDGTLYDSSHDQGAPVEAKLGGQQLVPGIEMALVGMKVGEKQTVALDPEEAYGSYDPELIFTVNRAQLPESLVPEVGMEIGLTTAGEEIEAQVVKVEEDLITLDANHPLAGQRVEFDLELIAIGDKSS